MPTAKTQTKTPANNTPQTAEQNRPKIKATINRIFDDEQNPVKAVASLTIGGAYAVHGIKVISSQKGDFVAMPSTKYNDKYNDTFHAVTAEARQEMNDAVMAAYQQKLTETQDENQEESEGMNEPEDAPAVGSEMSM